MGAIIALLAPMFIDILKRVIPDPVKSAEAQQEMQKLLNEAAIEALKAEAIETEAKKEIIVAEMSKDSWAGQWRAYLMIICIAIVGYNWIVVSLLNAFLIPLGLPITALAVPPELWTLVTIGLGGYIGKETMQNYSAGKVEKAKAENPPNDRAFFDTMRGMFPKGMSAEQVELMHKALKARQENG